MGKAGRQGQRPWTTREVGRAKEMKASGRTAYSIARELGRSEQSVKSLLSRAGIVVLPRMTDEEVAFLRENYHRGTAYCAQRLGRTRDAVKEYVYRHRDELFGSSEGG